MRAALESLQARVCEMEAAQIAVEVYDIRPAADGVIYMNRAQVVAVRRALVQLVRRGEVRDMGWGRHGRRYANPSVARESDRKERAAFGRVWPPTRPIPMVKAKANLRPILVSPGSDASA